MRTYARLLTMLLLCDVHKPVATILYDNANMQMHIKHTSRSVIFSKRDYVTFAICRLSSDVCRLSVTLVSPTQPVKIFRSFFHYTIRWPSVDIHKKFYGDRPRGTPTSGDFNARGQ